MSIEMIERFQRYMNLVMIWNGFKPGSDDLGRLHAFLWDLAFVPLPEDQPA